jgi:DNA polymerase III delta prime subunit
MTFVLTGPPGAGKTTTLIALSDALADDGIPHAAIDVDELAFAFPYPTLDERCAYLAAWWGAHRDGGRPLALVAEVIESPGHLRDVLAAIEADAHLLVRLQATPATLQDRIVAREPPTWSGLPHLLAEAGAFATSQPELEGVHLVLDTERHDSPELARRIRAAWPEVLGADAR